MMRSALLGSLLLPLYFAENQLEGHSDGGRLARCPDCSWRMFLQHLSDSTGCRAPGHKGRSFFVANGPVRVRCFYDRCRNESVTVDYVQGRHTAADFRCALHRVEA